MFVLTTSIFSNLVNVNKGFSMMYEICAESAMKVLVNTGFYFSGIPKVNFKHFLPIFVKSLML